MQDFAPNSLEEQWMPFTANRDFKANPRLVVKTEGVYLYDHHGGKVIDGSSGMFCSPAGHCRVEIVEAVHKQMQQLGYVSPFGTAHASGFALARRIAKLTPESINHVFFVTSGSEAVDTALKIAMAYHHACGDAQRLRFVSRERAYHGVSIGGVSLSGMAKTARPFRWSCPMSSCCAIAGRGRNYLSAASREKGVELADDLERLCQNYGGSTIAAVFIEPVAGSTGILVPPKGYLSRIREICDRHGILLVFDEVICGFGRMGANFAADAFGVTPDIMTMAKALTNGAIPMGAVAVRDDIYEAITQAAPDGTVEFFHGYTYSAHPAACAAGIATLDLYASEDLFTRAAQMSEYFNKPYGVCAIIRW